MVGDLLRLLVTAKPSSPGSITSSSIRSTGSRLSRSSAAGPSNALEAGMPHQLQVAADQLVDGGFVFHDQNFANVNTSLFCGGCLRCCARRSAFVTILHVYYRVVKGKGKKRGAGDAGSRAAQKKALT